MLSFIRNKLAFGERQVLSQAVARSHARRYNPTGLRAGSVFHAGAGDSHVCFAITRSKVVNTNTSQQQSSRLHIESLTYRRFRSVLHEDCQTASRTIGIASGRNVIVGIED